MADALFGEPRLAAIYDAVEGERRGDLDHYLAIAEEFGARSLLDVGCGTGILARRAAGQGMEVTGVDPAAGSLDVARGKPGAERVRWLHGDATGLPDLQVDLATMTANVAHVFLTDEDWSATLRGVHAALRPGGHLVFEVRDPARRRTYVFAADGRRSRRIPPGASGHGPRSRARSGRAVTCWPTCVTRRTARATNGSSSPVS